MRSVRLRVSGRGQLPGLLDRADAVRGVKPNSANGHLIAAGPLHDPTARSRLCSLPVRIDQTSRGARDRHNWAAAFPLTEVRHVSAAQRPRSMPLKDGLVRLPEARKSSAKWLGDSVDTPPDGWLDGTLDRSRSDTYARAWPFAQPPACLGACSPPSRPATISAKIGRTVRNLLNAALIVTAMPMHESWKARRGTPVSPIGDPRGLAPSEAPRRTTAGPELDSGTAPR
jgi:hypothetical protein